jgi:hypothetical protein
MTFTTLNIEGQDIFVQNSANNKDGENWNATFTDLVTPLSGVTRSLYFPVYLPNNPIMEFGDFNIVNVSPSLVYVNYAQNLILSWPMTFDNYFDGYTNLALYRATVSENVITNININWRCKGTLTFTPTFDGQIDAFIIAERASISQLITPLGGAQIANNVFLTAYTACVIPFDISEPYDTIEQAVIDETSDAQDAFDNIEIKPQGIKAQYCPDYLLKAATKAWDDAVQLGEKYGYRTAQATVIAPTGTIGLVMDCDTTGVEPDFALVKFKKLSGGGYFKIINQSIPTALHNLGYIKIFFLYLGNIWIFV